MTQQGLGKPNRQRKLQPVFARLSEISQVVRLHSRERSDLRLSCSGCLDALRGRRARSPAIDGSAHDEGREKKVGRLRLSTRKRHPARRPTHGHSACRVEWIGGMARSIISNRKSSRERRGSRPRSVRIERVASAARDDRTPQDLHRPIGQGRLSALRPPRARLPGEPGQGGQTARPAVEVVARRRRYPLEERHRTPRVRDGTRGIAGGEACESEPPQARREVSGGGHRGRGRVGTLQDRDRTLVPRSRFRLSAESAKLVGSGGQAGRQPAPVVADGRVGVGQPLQDGDRLVVGRDRLGRVSGL